ncbi:MAG: 50S ribosomal protein L10 [archaeon]|jgi:large subunit ribosomal protein L10
MTSHTKKWKANKRIELAGLAKTSKFVAVATLDKLPASIVSVLRKKLAGKAELRVSKTRVVQRALVEAGIDTKKLDPYIAKSVLVIFSKINPFELFSFVKKNKGSAAAKENDVADADILVQAGDTGLPPGPALSTLKAAGLEVKVAGATIAISKDKVVAKKGEPIKKEVADVLGKLNIKPIKIGMSIIGVLDLNDNTFYAADVLDVDEEELFNKFVLAYQQSMNLAVNAEIFEDKAVELIVVKAQREANALEKEIASVVPTQ